MPFHNKPASPPICSPYPAPLANFLPHFPKFMTGCSCLLLIHQLTYFCRATPQFSRTLGKGFPWNNTWNSSINLACCQTPQKRQVVCWCRVQLDLLTKDCFYSISNSSPKFPLSVLVTDALHLKPCLPIYLLEPTEFVLVLNPFPNIFVLKSNLFFFFNFQRLQLFYTLYVFMGKMLKIFYLQNAFHDNTQFLFGKLLSPKKAHQEIKREYIYYFNN